MKKKGNIAKERFYALDVSITMILVLSALQNHGRGYYSTPYDSTQGVPAIVFIGFWVIILLFGIRLAWEYRDKIFVKKPDPDKGKNPEKQKKH